MAPGAELRFQDYVSDHPSKGHSDGELRRRRDGDLQRRTRRGRFQLVLQAGVSQTPLRIRLSVPGL